MGVNIKTMERYPERDRIASFQHQKNLGNKYVKQYALEEIEAPGSDTPHTVLRPWDNGIVS